LSAVELFRFIAVNPPAGTTNASVVPPSVETEQTSEDDAERFRIANNPMVATEPLSMATYEFVRVYVCPADCGDAATMVSVKFVPVVCVVKYAPPLLITSEPV
jgi:hypothetical protein